MQLHTWVLFLLTAMGISLTPGPNCLLALTHGALHGSRKTLFTIAGGLLGFAVIIALCTFGIGALLKASVHWLIILKVAGGVYLVWLGIKLLRAPAMEISVDASAQAKTWTLFRQGLLCGVTNPKSMVFFSALLPQFIDPGRSLVLQCLAMVATYTVTEFLVEYGLAHGATRLRPWLAKAGRRFNVACGCLFIAIGAALPLRS